MTLQIEELKSQAFADWTTNGTDINTRLIELVLEKCIEICEDGAKVQMTSSGAAFYIKHYFGLSK